MKKKINTIGIIVSILAAITACDQEDSNLISEDTSQETNTTPDDNTTDVTLNYPELLTVWVMNETDESAPILSNGNGDSTKSLVNVQSITSDGVSYAVLQTSGIPNYDIYINQDQIDWLNNRPKAATDFDTGSTTASSGDLIEFGTDIGYINTQCALGEGQGYWPPGPGCPTNQNKNVSIPLTPSVNTTDDGDIGLGAIGYAVNGVSIYGWGDGQTIVSNGDSWSTGRGGSFQTLAPVAELYDVDLCWGHAAMGDYHHHFYSSCWEAVTEEDSASTHSAIFGFSADGYPVYGPYHDKSSGTLATSCWKVRDYSHNTDTGCSDNTRSCVMVDPYDPTQGTKMVNAGPDFSEHYTSLSGNDFIATNGSFFEDYYYDASCSAQENQYLDQYNGHDHDDLGYHYHLTIDSNGTATFPYTFGPKYKGNVPEGTNTMIPGGDLCAPPPEDIALPPGDMPPSDCPPLL